MSSRTWAHALLEAGNAGPDYREVAEKRCAVIELIAAALSAQPEITYMLRDPGIHTSKAVELMDSVLVSAGADTETRRLIGLLVNRRAFGALSGISTSARRIIDQQNSTVRATVDSAASLSVPVQSEIETMLARTLNVQKVIAQFRIRPELIGGIRATAGAYTWDDSIQGRLNRLEKSISTPIFSKKEHTV